MGTRQTLFFTPSSQPPYEKKKVTEVFIEGNTVQSQTIFENILHSRRSLAKMNNNFSFLQKYQLH